MTISAALRAEADHFAARLSSTLFGALGVQTRVSAQLLGDRTALRTNGPVVLTVGGEPLLDLDIEFHCDWDEPQKFMAVVTSSFKVKAHGERSPLFRYEFEKSAHASIPTAHLQIHAHRDAFTWVMTKAGKTTKRSRARASGSDQPPRMEELHFPLGGRRFRPALEDLLEMLVEEFGIDMSNDWRTHLAKGREDWRRVQVKAAVRDSHVDAAEALRELGYAVTEPQSSIGEWTGALRQY